MGVVYRAVDERLARDVAIKLLSPGLVGDATARHRLHQEASLLSKLNHPNITTIHDFETDGEIVFVVMELVPGRSVAEVLAYGRVDERQILVWGEQLCEGLANAHALGIIHRDLKPANLRITPQGRLKILDFGLAKMLATSSSGDDITALRTAAGGFSGTLPYMAPEQFNGAPADVRTDIHAVGAILYELSTGYRPFTGRNVAELIRAITLDRPASPTSVGAAISAELESLIERCLEKEADRRYQSAAGVVADLRHLSRGLSITMSAAEAVAPLAAAEARTSIALLPFENATGTVEYAYLAFALADAVAAQLSRVASLNVRPLSSTRKYASDSVQPRAAGVELGVQIVIAGQFTVDPANVRVTLEVIDVERDHLLWATTLRVKRDAWEQIDAEVAASVEHQLLPALGVHPLRQFEERPSADAQAYDLYLRAVALGDDSLPNSKALSMLAKAVEIDPAYAPAWSQLGRRLNLEASYGHGRSEAYESSEKAFQRALALDPDLVAAASGLIVHWTEKGDLVAAFDVVRGMLARRPRSVELHSAAAYVLRFAGLHRESAAHAETALQIDRDPRLGHAALTYLALEEYERALDFLALREGRAWAENVRMFIFLHQGARADALAAARRILLDPVWPARFVVAFLENRPADDVRRLAAEFITGNVRVLRDPESSFLDGTLMCYCGLPDLALSLIQNAITGGYVAYPNLLTDRLLVNMRTMPEFDPLVADARARQKAFVDYRLRATARTAGSSADQTMRP